MEEVTIARIITQVQDQICGGYCKWPGVYGVEGSDTDDQMEKMIAERCDNCPLHRLA